MSSSPRPRARARLGLIGASLALAGGAALAALPAVGAAAEEAPQEIVLAQLAGDRSDAAAGDVAARTGLALESNLPEIGWAVYGIDGDAASAHGRLVRDPSVARIDFVAPGERQSLAFTPRDIIMTNPGQVALGGVTAPWNWHWLKASFPAAWDISRGSPNVRVAVIDSEFDTEHVDLKTKLATGRNFDSGTAEYGTSNVRAQTIDTAFHGSHVAGLVGAATDNGEGVPGACFECVVIPFKIGFGGQSNVDEKFVRDLTEALVAAGNSDATVINMSLGTSRDHAPLRAAVDYARARGKVVVAAAGNSQLGQQGPAGVPNYPGAYPGVIAVASTRPDDSISPSSTNGDFVDVAAPGNPILSTWDSRLRAADGPELAPTHGDGYKVLSGTSMASPIAAGLAALMKTVRPDLTPDEVELLMEGSSDDLGAVGWDPVYGAGRINALRALQAAQAYVRPVAPQPVAAPRKRVRIVVTCTVGARKVKFGPGRLGVRKGARLSCKGRTAPALRKAQLEVQRFAARGGWTRIGKVKTNNRGRFGFTVRLRTVGNWTVRAAYAGNVALLPAGSLGAKLVVAPRR